MASSPTSARPPPLTVAQQAGHEGHSGQIWAPRLAGCPRAQPWRAPQHLRAARGLRQRLRHAPA
eukprot:10085911-Alexandrium_andersonii.AAC.1